TAPHGGAVTAPEPLRAPPPRAAAEQRHLTVMFCDIVDSTRLAATLDLETLQRVVDAYQHQVATCVTRYDGFVAKFMGDGVLVYFGYPQAHEDDAERAVRAGLDIVAAVPSVRAVDSPELACRIGIASGVVVVGDSLSVGSAAEKSVLGETPNLAARLQAAAARNGVIVAASTRALVANLFDLKPIDPLALKGNRGWRTGMAGDRRPRRNQPLPRHPRPSLRCLYRARRRTFARARPLDHGCRRRGPTLPAVRRARPRQIPTLRNHVFADRCRAAYRNPSAMLALPCQ